MILNASGCLDPLAAPDVARSLDAVVTKTVTPARRDGNPPVRIAETEVGMLNSIGLANPGLDVFLADVLPRLAALGVPLWVSAGGFRAADYAEVCARLDGRPEVDVVELNVSCPNVEAPHESAAEIVRAARGATSKPLFAKLSPAVPDVGSVAVAAVEAGADGLSLVNTLRGAALDPRTLRPVLSTGSGGLSGPALKPVALAAVLACARALGETGALCPIVGMGGVATGRDALELIAAGAAAVALGTVLFSDPGAPARIRSQLAAEAAARGASDPLELRGTASGIAPLFHRQPVENSAPSGAKKPAISTRISA